MIRSWRARGAWARGLLRGLRPALVRLAATCHAIAWFSGLAAGGETATTRRPGDLIVYRFACHDADSMIAIARSGGVADLAAALDGVDLAEVCITSGITLSDAAPPAGAFTIEEVAGVGVEAGRAEGGKCQRCWRVLPEVGGDQPAPEICGRCADAVRHLGAAAG